MLYMPGNLCGASSHASMLKAALSKVHYTILASNTDPKLLSLRLHLILYSGTLWPDRVFPEPRVANARVEQSYAVKAIWEQIHGLLLSSCRHFHFGINSRLSVRCFCKLSNFSFERALTSQPAMPDLQLPIFKFIGAALFLLGNTLVLSSMYALGITGTYLGYTKVEDAGLW